MSKRISVVISQSPSKNPVKRKLEEDIVAALLFENGIDVTVVPNLYDIKPDSTSMLALQSIGGNVVVCSWLFERAAHWVLDRAGIAGHVGEIMLTFDSDDDDEEDNQDLDADSDDNDDAKQVVNATRTLPNRKIYCLDFKASPKASDFIDEVKRIHIENAVRVVTLGDVIGGGRAATAVQTETNGAAANPTTDSSVDPTTPADEAAGQLQRIEESGGRRWYPVIDYNRCTNCMECIDFCLFGVYGVDRIDTILVEQPDNCRKGCPACSRVCPENAIMFPQHKTPAIAGSNDASASLKIDLSQLFGAPASGKSAEEVAAMERDEQLLLVGRDAVGLNGVPPKRATSRTDQPKDDLDDLVDQLNDLDL